MNKKEYEIIACSKVQHINIFFSHVTCRNFHMHKEYELLCVLDGNATVRKSGESIALSPGDILLLNSHEAHEIDALENPVTFLVVQISNHFLNDFGAIQSFLFEKTLLTQHINSEQKKHIWHELLTCAQLYLCEEDLFELKCSIHIAQIILFLIQNLPHTVYTQSQHVAKKKIIKRMNNITSYIDQNMHRTIYLQDIAELEGITATYVSQFFTKNFGATFQEYLNQVRFEHAVRLIRSSDLSLYDIAINSGFSDPRYMTKIFQKQLGCHPREYREKARPIAQLDSLKNELDYRFTKSESTQLIQKFYSELCNSDK